MPQVPDTDNHRTLEDAGSHRAREERVSALSGLLDAAAAATRLATTERHLRHLYETRQLAAIKVGKKVRFRQQDLDEYIDAHRIERLR